MHTVFDKKIAKKVVNLSKNFKTGLDNGVQIVYNINNKIFPLYEEGLSEFSSGFLLFIPIPYVIFVNYLLFLEFTLLKMHISYRCN